jgi:hypothetical protein
MASVSFSSENRRNRKKTNVSIMGDVGKSGGGMVAIRACKGQTAARIYVMTDAAFVAKHSQSINLELRRGSAEGS